MTDIAAPVSRVWRALTEPAEVLAWDGAVPVDVPHDYPKAGQHATWLVTLGPGRRVVLHDRVRAVQENRLLQSDIAYAFVRLDETYALEPGADGHGCRLLTMVTIAAAPPVLGSAATIVAVPAIRSAMAGLKRHCER